MRLKFSSHFFSLLAVSLLLLNSCKENNEEREAAFPVEYIAPYKVTAGKSFKIDFSSFTKEVKTVEITLDNQRLKSWSGPFQATSLSFDLSDKTVGTQELKINVVLSDGEKMSDSQIITIVSDITPEEYKAEIITKYPHNPTHFTQGLEIVNGLLYEGTGDPDHGGNTKVMEKNLKTGEVLKEQDLASNYFGEGITIFKNQLYQITWTSQRCFVYDFPSLEKKAQTFSYTGEGWGLTHDDKSIIMSDGSDRIYFRNPTTFQTERVLQVADQNGIVKNLNELEYIDGLIYANIWMTDKIIAIDPATGKVIKTIDCTQVASQIRGNGDVLNGIAFDSETKKIYLTGKYFPYLVEVKW